MTIILTCYNQEKFIVNTLKSVRDQDYKYWECIIVDDGSTDESASLIDDFIKNDPRFIYVYQDNKGVTSARNLGFELSKGNFIQILDGDDTFLPNKLSEQVEFFKEHPDVFICICDHQHFYEKNKQTKYYNFEPIQEKPLQQLLYKWELGVAFPPHAALYRKSLWDPVEDFFPSDYTERSEDWVFNILVALKGKKYHFLNRILCNYHINDESFTANNINGSIAPIYAAFYINKFLPEEFQKDFIDHTIKKTLKRYLDLEKPKLYKESGNWRLGNFISKPFFYLKKLRKTN